MKPKALVWVRRCSQAFFLLFFLFLLVESRLPQDTDSYGGGYSVATKDVLPYSKTVGNRACIYGVNGLGLERRGFEPERVKAIRQAYRILLQSRLNTTEALARIDSEGPRTPEVRGLVEFIRSSKRGVILKRRNPHRASGG